MANENALLAALPADDRRRVLAQFDDVPLPKGKVLFELDDVVQHAYFPMNGLISLVAMTPNDQAIELAMVGNDGFVGLPIVLAGTTSPYQIIVRFPGRALRANADAFSAVLRQSPAFQEALLRYAHDLHVQIAEAVLCHHFHTAPQRLSRWLLRAGERVGTDTLPLTHEVLAHVLGITRSVVTRAALELQDAGHISYRHGRIVIKDRRQLKMTACDCHRPHHGRVDRKRSAG